MQYYKLLCVALLGAIAPLCLAQKTADEYYQAEDWPQVEIAYRAVLDETPDNGQAWYRLAVAQRYLRKFDAALASLDKAANVGVPVSYTGYEKAKTYASDGQPENAIRALRAAADAGLNVSDRLTAEALDPIRDHAEFANIQKIVARNEAPCSADPQYNAFDFWLGEWDVVDANGTPQGTNIITKAEKNCLMLERWTSAAGNTGQSINYFDPRSGKWHQQWVSSGALIDLAGNVVDGAMHLTGAIFYHGNSNEALLRGTWTPLEDGRVRQFFEQSTDEGLTWQPWFDGYYSQKAPGAVE